MDYEALIDEYNVCVVEQSGVMKKKTLEQLKEEQHHEQQRELECQQLELLIFDAKAKTVEAEARVEAEQANAEARVEARASEAQKLGQGERVKAEARVEAQKLGSRLSKPSSRRNKRVLRPRSEHWNWPQPGGR
ncbi:hypothetical protein BS47DRAFT_1337670, partial [Hydnum rufescens UP504]